MIPVRKKKKAVNSRFNIAINKRNLTIIAVAAALLLADGIVAYLNRAHDTPEKSAQQEVDELLIEVGKLIVLPANERPVVATVNDTDQLKSQPFFANAKKGDKVLLYNEARRAVLYSPTLKRVVDIAPLSVATPTPK